MPARAAAAKAPRKRVSKKKVPQAVGLSADEVLAGQAPSELDDLAADVKAAGGTPIASYREPLGGSWLLFASLPLAAVAPTPYQRELSKTHADRLTKVMGKVGLFLDPVIVVQSNLSAEEDGAARYWTPNGMHRLAALQAMGAKAVMALVVPNRDIAYRILALNTEKAHNLKDKALEVMRMARSLAAAPRTAKLPESTWAFEFEEPAFLTLGLCYERNGRFSGGVYQPVVRRCDEFSEAPISKALAERERRMERLMELDEAVAAVVARLREAGLKSAFLKPFVVARINPLRWVRPTKPGQPSPRADFDATIAKMLASARKFDASKVRPQDVAAMSGPPPTEE